MNTVNTLLTGEEKKKKQQTLSGGQSAAQPLVKDYSDLIRAEHAAAEKSALAGLEESYKKSLAELDAAKAALPATYNAARNQAAAEGAKANRNFDVTAAASGLGAGTGAQARLARSVTLQNQLGELNRAQSAALADLELQRAKAGSQYNAAVAEKKAENERSLADKLYAESVRVDETTAKRQQDERDFAFQKEQYADKKAQQDWENAFAQNEYDDRKEQQAWENAFSREQYDDKKAQQDWENAFSREQYDDKKTQQAWENAFSREQYDDKKTQQDWENAFSREQYDDKKTQQAWENAFSREQYDDKKDQQDWENAFARNEYEDRKTQQDWENTFERELFEEEKNQNQVKNELDERDMALAERKYQDSLPPENGNTTRAKNIIMGILHSGESAGADKIIAAYAKNIGLTDAEVKYLLDYFADYTW